MTPHQILEPGNLHPVSETPHANVTEWRGDHRDEFRKGLEGRKGLINIYILSGLGAVKPTEGSSGRTKAWIYRTPRVGQAEHRIYFQYLPRGALSKIIPPA